MNEHVYKQIELTGSSKTSIEDAVQSAITKASKSCTICVGFKSSRAGDILRMAKWIIGK